MNRLPLVLALVFGVLNVIGIVFTLSFGTIRAIQSLIPDSWNPDFNDDEEQ